MAFIQDLPFELLGLVFEYLYATNRCRYSRAIGSVMSGEESSYEDWVKRDFKDPNLFPWVLCRVCQFWSDVVAEYPHFWTRIALDVASPEPLPLGAFSWSKANPIDVIVFNNRLQGNSKESEGHRGDGTEEAVEVVESPTTATERRRVEAAMQALKPHLGRCTSLEFDLKFASSVTHLPILLDRTSPNLTNLKAAYQVLKRDNSYHISPTHDISLSAPTGLTTLCLPVSHFICILRINPSFFTMISALELYDYMFHDSTAQDSDIASTQEFFALLASLESLECLTIRDLDIRSDSTKDRTKAPTPTTPPAAGNHHDITVGSFTLANLSRPFFNAFCDSMTLDATSGLITHCNFSANANAVSASCLTLHRLPKGAKPERIVKGFPGVELRCLACPFLDDDMLRRLGKGSCRVFESLELLDCDGYSFHALKILVMAREELADDSGLSAHSDSVDGSSPMISIEIAGSAKMPTPEETAWFSQHLESWSCSS